MPNINRIACSVRVISNTQKPLMPCNPARARKLLKAGKAAVFMFYPFTIILKDRSDGEVQPISKQYDLGYKTTGEATIVHGKINSKVALASEITHRSGTITQLMQKRRGLRAGRRARKTRYRPARFSNRKRKSGLPPPSIESRVSNVLTDYKRSLRFLPITDVKVELGQFDVQKMEKLDISGIEYQHGELFGKELKSYILARDNYTCQYCKGASKDKILNIDHVISRAMGGSNKVSNLITSCRLCNVRKGKRLLCDWLAWVKTGRKTPYSNALRLNIPKVMSRRNVSYKAPAHMHWSGKVIVELMKEIGLPVEICFGYQTKLNRKLLNKRKEHWIDAACLGDGGSNILFPKRIQCLRITALKRNSRQLVRTDAFGFPKVSPKECSSVKGFKTGDIVSYKNKIGRIAIRKSGSFNFTCNGVTLCTTYKVLKTIQKMNGCDYSMVLFYV